MITRQFFNCAISGASTLGPCQRMMACAASTSAGIGALKSSHTVFSSATSVRNGVSTVAEASVKRNSLGQTMTTRGLDLIGRKYLLSVRLADGTDKPCVLSVC